MCSINIHELHHPLLQYTPVKKCTARIFSRPAAKSILTAKTFLYKSNIAYFSNQRVTKK